MGVGQFFLHYNNILQNTSNSCVMWFITGKVNISQYTNQTGYI